MLLSKGSTFPYQDPRISSRLDMAQKLSFIIASQALQHELATASLKTKPYAHDFLALGLTGTQAYEYFRLVRKQARLLTNVVQAHYLARAYRLRSRPIPEHL